VSKEFEYHPLRSNTIIINPFGICIMVGIKFGIFLLVFFAFG